MHNYLKPVNNMNNTEIDSVLLISSNEFRRVIRDPLVIVVSCVLFVLTVINAIGNANTMPSMLSDPGMTTLGQDVFIQYGVEPIFTVTLELCSLVALFIGAMSLAEETTGRSIGILVVKPLYRRDVIAGKFIGLNTFILLLVAANFTLCSVLLAYFYGIPTIMIDSVLRLSAFILVVFLICSITMTVAMLIGIVLKDMLQAALVATTYYIADSHGIINGCLGSLGKYTPKNIFKIGRAHV